ncbi:MAG: sulfatase [Opitutales bacterium]
MSADSSRPNILFLLSDDHAVQAISALGSRLNHTPHIDRIAAAGGVFDQSFCCNSICTPSRASILTGKHSFQNGVLTLRDAIDPAQNTFARQMRAAGYQTALAGKWHLHSEPQDFDMWKVLPGQGKYYNPNYLVPGGTVREEGYSEDITTDTILNWLDHRDRQRPWLACCQFKAPHRPWMPPPRHYNKFDDVEFPMPDNIRDDYANRASQLKENKMEIARHMNWNTDLKVIDPGPNRHRLNIVNTDGQHGEWELDRMSDTQRAAWEKAYAARNEYVRTTELDDDAFLRFAYHAYLSDYLGCIQAIDDNVGRLLDWLEASGEADNTIVVYCSDQGFYLGEHGWYDKRWMFEESMRMPLIVQWPGKIAPGTRYDQLVQNIDYAPTFLEACGLDVPEEIHGTSLLRVIEDGTHIHDDLYYHYYMSGDHGVPAHDGVRTLEHKLIHFYERGEYNLFDLAKDPAEMASVHDDPSYADIFAEMKRRYFAARERWEVPAKHGVV